MSPIRNPVSIFKMALPSLQFMAASMRLWGHCLFGVWWMDSPASGSWVVPGRQSERDLRGVKQQKLQGVVRETVPRAQVHESAEEAVACLPPPAGICIKPGPQGIRFQGFGKVWGVWGLGWTVRVWAKMDGISRVSEHGHCYVKSEIRS